MDNDTPAHDAAVTKADHDKGVAQARAAGVTEGTAAGVKAERARFAAVQGSEHYAGREKSANHMLTTTDMTAEAIIGVLAGIDAPKPAAAAPPAQPDANRGPNGISAMPATDRQSSASRSISANEVYASRRKAG